MSEPAAQFLRGTFWYAGQQPDDLPMEARRHGVNSLVADRFQDVVRCQYHSLGRTMFVIGNVYSLSKAWHEAAPQIIRKDGVQYDDPDAVYCAPLSDPASEIANATTTDDVVAALKRQRLGAVADRVAGLSRLHEIDPDEPQLDVASLKEMAAALVRNPKLRVPQLTLSESGFLHAEWRTVDGGSFAMTFLPSGRVEFGAISAPAVGGADVLRIGGLHFGGRRLEGHAVVHRAHCDPMTGDQLPETDHVAYYCSSSKIDDRGLPSARAFLPRNHEQHLSVNWLEHFGEPNQPRAVARVRLVLANKMTIRRSGKLAVLNVGEVKNAARRAGNTTLGIEHRPEPCDQSHAGITGYSSGDLVVGLALQSLVRDEHMHPAVL